MVKDSKPPVTISNLNIPEQNRTYIPLMITTYEW